mgnify:CR=1 FL=1|jgi:hypothetical protein
MTTPTKVPGIPRPPASVDAETRAYLTALAEAVEIRLGRRGDPVDRAVTLRELVAGGLAVNLQEGLPFNEQAVGTVTDNGTTIGAAPTPAPVDFTPPAVVTNLAATGAYSVINLSWNPVTDGTGTVIEVWSHTSDVLGDATLTAVVVGFTYSDPVGSAQTRYYWVRAVSAAGVFGSFNASAGTAATTDADVDFQLDVLANAITTSELATSLASPIGAIPGLQGQYSVKIDNNGHIAGFGLSSTTTTAGPTSAFIVRADRFAVIDPASTADGLGTTTPTAANVPFFIDSGTTYIKAAAIKDASITSAKIGTLAADKITSGTLNADRIGAGSLNVSKLDLVGTGAQINLKSAATGARMIIQDDKIQVYDSTGAQRVRLGNLTS